MAEDMLRKFVDSALQRVRQGYYDIPEGTAYSKRSIKERLKRSRLAVIAELKYASPSAGVFGCRKSPVEVASMYERAGAVAVSVLTDPDHFSGKIDYIREIREGTSLPILMKDFVVDKKQVLAAYRSGADAILVINSIFSKGYLRGNISELIDLAHNMGLEVIEEVHSYEEYLEALHDSADIIGINNRNLQTLEVSLSVSSYILQHKSKSKPVICESGITKGAELLELKKEGADGFLIGSTLMKADDPGKALAELLAVQ
ncbi:MAG: indole-3-glycerol phosphate synthase TrpC [Conexivisphaerales archaeon]